EQVGLAVINVLAWFPLMALQIAIGLMWDWRRFIVIWLIFHAIFAFFFTTVFTNIAGLATGMVYSLGYWLEQQGVRRGSQPQYYYLLIIMPFYEFLPVIGSVLAMFGGLNVFWGWRKHDNSARIELKRREKLALMQEIEGDEDIDDAIAEIEREIDDSDVLSAQDIDHIIGRHASQTIFSNPIFWGLAVLTLIGILTYIVTGFRTIF